MTGSEKKEEGPEPVPKAGPEKLLRRASLL